MQRARNMHESQRTARNMNGVVIDVVDAVIMERHVVRESLTKGYDALMGTWIGCEEQNECDVVGGSHYSDQWRLLALKCHEEDDGCLHMLGSLKWQRPEKE